MTALDDALNSSSIVFGPHPLKAYWRESDNLDIDTNTGAIGNLTDQSDGTMLVAHALDDALPDPVTMTTDGNASGSLTAGLKGSDGVKLWQSGFRSFVNANSLTGSWNSDPTTTNLVVPLPNNAVTADSLIAAVIVNSATANIYQTVQDPKDQWEILGSVVDGTYRLLIYFKRRQSLTNPLLVLSSDVAVNFLAHTLAFWGLSPASSPIDFKSLQATFATEPGTVAAHSITAVQPVTGYTVTFWGQASATGNMTTTGVTKFAGPAANGVQITSGISSFREAGSYTSTGTNAGTDSAVPMASITMQPYERPPMDARQYFSPFNKDSPVYGYDRDTSSVLAWIRTLTASGPVDTQIFSGQMQDIPIQGRQATVMAVSKTRIRLNRTVALPVVSGFREGLTLDWLITWLASRGGQYAGPAPNRYTRYWAPMHGSIHPHLCSQYAYSNAVYFDASRTPTGPWGYKNPTSVPGPFVSGMYAQQSSTLTKRIRLYTVADFPGEPTDAFPNLDPPFQFDVFSQANSKGRICFWVRGDALATPIAYSTEDYVMQTFLTVSQSDTSTIASVILGIDGPNRRPFLQMGSVTPGNALVTYGASGNLPTDDAWHFFGFWWDFAAGTARVNHNGTISSSDFWATNGFNVVADLPSIDGEGGTYTRLDSIIHLPISEFMYDAGWPDPGTDPANWNDQYPSPTSPGQSMLMRPTNQPLQALAETTAVNPWDTLADVAKSSLSAYRVNEQDKLEFLPLSYFGETAQMTSSAVQDTKTNAQDLDVIVDPTKVRNSITVEFEDTRIDTNPQPVGQYNTSIDLPRGESFIVFPLDVPCVEIHGAIDLDSLQYTIANLTSSQITTPSLPVARHFMTINTNADGTGTVLPESSVFAQIVATDALSITIRFVNLTTTTAYLANSGNQIPFLLILGYGVRISEGYSTITDSKSVAIRGERGLETQLPWVQDRSTAEKVAGIMSGILARPRPQVGMTVMGNPLRKPGQLVTIADSEGTAAAGFWRVLGVKHNVNGPEYTQDLSLVQVLPAAVWDGADGWDEGVWS